MKNVVYVLECRNGRHYIGSAADLNVRLEQHKNGRVAATKYLLPFRLLGFCSFGSAREARQAEYRLKRQKSRKATLDFIKLEPSA